MSAPSPEEIRDAVRERYGAAARSVLDGAVAPDREAPDGEAPHQEAPDREVPDREAPDREAKNTQGQPPRNADLLYAEDQVAELPQDAVLASLGCGNPTALAQLEPGQVVLDLGSGGGLDVLLSARRVGPTGKAYGLDMTPEMLALARRNQAEAGITNAEFLAGTIENVPLPDASVDVIISNCVINLSADKGAVLREAFRVLKPGGLFAVSDLTLSRPLPEVVRSTMALWAGCVAGALLDAEYCDELAAAGFVDVDIHAVQIFDRATVEDVVAGVRDTLPLPPEVDLDDLVATVEGVVRSSFVRARKPLSV